MYRWCAVQGTLHSCAWVEHKVHTKAALIGDAWAPLRHKGPRSLATYNYADEEEGLVLTSLANWFAVRGTASIPGLVVDVDDVGVELRKTRRGQASTEHMTAGGTTEDMHISTSFGGTGGRGCRGLRTIEDSSARLFGISTVHTVSLGTLRAAACMQ